MPIVDSGGSMGGEQRSQREEAARAGRQGWSDEGLAAVVISGAGARGAYEAGVLSTLLPRLFPRGLGNVLLLGTSAGAINAAQWAQRAVPGRPLAEVGDEVCQFWAQLDVSQVYRPVIATVVRRALRLDWLGKVEGILDTMPSRRLAERTFHASAIARNLAQHSLAGVGVVATSCPLDGSGGRSRVFYQGRGIDAPKPDDTSALDYVATQLAPEHVLASAAIPSLFPAVRISTPVATAGYYCDGGLRLNTPIEPALKLGARRLVVVSSNPMQYPAPANLPNERPDLVDLAAQAMHTALADGMIEDLRALRRTNRMVAQAREQGVELVDHMVQPPRPYVYVPLVEVSPAPGLLAQVAREVLSTSTPYSLRQRYRRLEYQLLRRAYAGLGAGPGNDELLSYLFFEPTFAKRQIDLGRRDGIQAYERIERAARELSGSRVATATPRA
jgi:NTE family protein